VEKPQGSADSALRYIIPEIKRQLKENKKGESLKEKEN